MVHMLSSLPRAAVLCAALLATSTTYALPQSSSACTKTHPLVGATITLRSVAPTVRLSGSVVIADDCTAFVQDFSVTGASSPFFLVGFNPAAAGVAIPLFSNDQLLVTGDTQRLILNSGITWSSATAFQLLAGSILIGGGSFPVQTSTTTTTTTTTRSPTPTIPAVFTAGPSPTPAAEKVLSGPQIIVVTTGPNPNYPLPPTQLNVSFYLNYQETPVLNLTRGVTYTFVIMGGPTHPFYLTTSSNGAKGANASSSETVFLGGAKTFGDSNSPFQLTFTPDRSHPNQFFYQCWNHRRMGWQVRLVDGPSGNTTRINGTAAPDNGTAVSVPNLAPPPQVVSGAIPALATSGALAIIMVVLAAALMF